MLVFMHLRHSNRLTWVFASGALVFERSELLPGADVAVSVMLPMPTEW